MSTRAVEEYAHKYGVSNNGAKRRMGRKWRSGGSTTTNLPQRGQPVAGTGKPSKGRK